MPAVIAAIRRVLNGRTLRSPILAAAALGVVSRLSAQAALGAFPHPETWEYEDIANNLLAGHGYTYVIHGATYVGAVSSPLYVLLTAAVYLFTSHSQAAMLVVQALLGGATAGLVAWMAGRAFSRGAAWLAGGLAAVDPALLVYAAKLHSLNLDVLAFAAVLCLAVALPRQPHWKHLAALGAVVGLASLTRSTVLFFLPLLVLWIARYRRMRLFSLGTLMLVGVALVVFSPWPVRNSLLLGQPVMGSSESTEWLWRGTNPMATGSSYTADGRLMLDAAPADFRARVLAADEVGRMDIYRDAALSFIRENPSQAVGLYLTKLWGFWWGSTTTGETYPSGWVPLYYAWYFAVLVCAAGGVWAALRRPEAWAVTVLLLLALAAVSASQALFYVEGRHRIAVEPLLLVLAGGGLAAVSAIPLWRRERRVGTLPAAPAKG